jgi:hypothetical protein
MRAARAAAHAPLPARAPQAQRREGTAAPPPDGAAVEGAALRARAALSPAAALPPRVSGAVCRSRAHAPRLPRVSPAAAAAAHRLPSPAALARLAAASPHRAAPLGACAAARHAPPPPPFTAESFFPSPAALRNEAQRRLAARMAARVAELDAPMPQARAQRQRRTRTHTRARASS